MTSSQFLVQIRLLFQGTRGFVTVQTTSLWVEQFTWQNRNIVRKPCQGLTIHHKSHMDCGRKELYHAWGLNYDSSNDRCFLAHGRVTHINKNMPLSVGLLYKGYRGSFLGVKRSGRDVEQSGPSSAEVTNEISKEWDTFTLTTSVSLSQLYTAVTPLRYTIYVVYYPTSRLKERKQAYVTSTVSVCPTTRHERYVTG